VTCPEFPTCDDAPVSAPQSRYPNFTVHSAAGTAEVLIDRPDKRNALTIAMWRTLAAICTDLAADAELRAVVVSGAGPSFCAGADISALSEDDAAMKAAVSAGEEALRGLAVPTVAKIRGHCMGGGNQIAIACDLRVADTSAVFAVPPAKLSVVYPANSTQALVALVGPAAAKRLLFTAATIDATEALRIGLVDELAAPQELDAAVDRIVGAILPLAPLTQASSKQLINTITRGGDAEAVQQRWYDEWRESEDGREGPRSFLERRAATFTWRPRR
jgi:enoyl-CoA hydratase/carnithine racemase